MKKQKTKYIQKHSISQNWIEFDATGKVLGRLASEIAKLLMGKQSVNYTPSSDLGHFVIVKNVEKIIVTGKKVNQKIYYRHSGYPGGLKETPYKEIHANRPEFILMSAVRGMLPKGRLGRKMLTKLKLFKGNEHIHNAQLSGKQEIAEEEI